MSSATIAALARPSSTPLAPSAAAPAAPSPCRGDDRPWLCLLPCAAMTNAELPDAGSMMDAPALVQLLSQNAQLMARQLDILQQLAIQRAVRRATSAAPHARLPRLRPPPRRAAAATAGEAGPRRRHRPRLRALPAADHRAKGALSVEQQRNLDALHSASTAAARARSKELTSQASRASRRSALGRRLPAALEGDRLSDRHRALAGLAPVGRRRQRVRRSRERLRIDLLRAQSGLHPISAQDPARRRHRDRPAVSDRRRGGAARLRHCRDGAGGVLQYRVGGRHRRDPHRTHRDRPRQDRDVRRRLSRHLRRSAGAPDECATACRERKPIAPGIPDSDGG